MSNRPAESAGIDSLRSAPTQNARSPVPASTTTCTRSSRLTSAKARPRSSYIFNVRALSLSGLARRMVATAPSYDTSIAMSDDSAVDERCECSVVEIQHALQHCCVVLPERGRGVVSRYAGVGKLDRQTEHRNRLSRDGNVDDHLARLHVRVGDDFVDRLDGAERHRVADHRLQLRL